MAWRRSDYAGVLSEAFTAVIREYIPEELWSEVVKRMEKVTREYYESIGGCDERILH